MSWTGSSPGHNVSTEQPRGGGAGASVHDWMFSGKSDEEGCDGQGRVRDLDVA
jgi:hypothetical protein